MTLVDVCSCGAPWSMLPKDHVCPVSDALGSGVSGKRLLRDEYIRLTVTREFAEREKGDCALGCRGESDDGRCGLKYDSPCCVYRKALRDDAAISGGTPHD